MWIDRGYLHLLNNSTTTLTLSNNEFDLITDRFGDFLEKNLQKVIKSHDRRPGTFKDTSEIKSMIEKYNREEVDLYDISVMIAKSLFQKRDKRESSDKTGLFVLQAGDIKENCRIDYIVGLEFKRMEKYQIDIKGATNSVILNPMLLANASPKKTPLFTINLNSMEVTVLEDDNQYFEEILGVDLGYSFNWILNKSRECLYNTLTKIEKRDTDYNDIVSSKNEEKINQVNKFENSVSWAVYKMVVDFDEISKEVFFDNKAQQKEFMKRLKAFKVPNQVATLSDGTINKLNISTPSEPGENRIKMENGIEVIVPNGLSEIQPIVIREVDGKLVIDQSV